ncbi:MAG TPA: hypothetical protein VHX38_41555 [Pseudonocardiaceae bacterium]|jgi:hypothetical protein|nr:hypothetical protein [Pseudonocardiaceae bacterium]
MTRPEVPDSPPIDFAVYGLRASWPVARWFEFFDVRYGDAAWGARFGHQAPGGVDSSYVCVATLPRQRFDQLCVGPHRDRVAEVAAYGGFMLINMTLPDPAVPQLPGLNSMLVKHADSLAEDHARWPSMSWVVGERPVRAAGWRFAGGWTAFCDDLPEVYLLATGWGVEPDGLAFDVIEDGTPYGVDLAAPLTTRTLPLAWTLAGPSMHSCPNHADYHPDQRSTHDGHDSR